MLQTTDVCFYHSVCRECKGDPLLTRALFCNGVWYGQYDELYSKHHIDFEKERKIISVHKVFTHSSMKTDQSFSQISKVVGSDSRNTVKQANTSHLYL